jgi:signal transduction histidine kinase/CheY-like chemotaxis protein
VRGLRDLPIRRKLLVIGLAAAVCALLVSSVIFLTASYVLVRRNVHENLRAQADIVADNTTAAVAFADRAAATETVRALRATPDVDLACVFDQQGRLFAQYARDGAAVACPDAPPPDQDMVRSSSVLIVRPIAVGARRVGTLYVRGTLSEVATRIRLQAYAALAGLMLGALVAVLIAERLQHIISGPIARLGRTAAEISRRGDYSVRAQRQGDDEVGTLVDTFNEMVGEVERRDEQLRAASRLKDEFLAAVSHELRTPLNAILGWLQILRTAPATPGMQERALGSLERNARAQARLIEDLLDISRIVSGKLHLKTGIVDLVTVVDAAIEVVRPAADAKHITIERRLPPDPCVVTGDADRLQQIVWNLLSNAVKFTPSGGRVEIQARQEGGTCLIEVRDSGIGISKDFLPYVFDRFRQADGSMTRQQGGLGLGLAIVRELVELHGGTVSASSDGHERGATFSIRLPRLAAAAVRQAEPAQKRAADLHDLAVLVVDDDADSRDVAGAALATVGARVEAVDSSAKALRAIGVRAFDVLVCDIAMPDVDGLTLMRQVREAGIVTPAVAVTAYASSDERARASAAGFQEFVAKPYDLSTLVDAIARARASAATNSSPADPV